MRRRRKIDLKLETLLEENHCTEWQLFEKALRWWHKTMKVAAGLIRQAIERYRTTGALVKGVREYVYQCSCGRCAVA